MTDIFKNLIPEAFDTDEANFDRICHSTPDSNVTLSTVLHCMKLSIRETHAENNSIKINMTKTNEQTHNFVCILYCIHLYRTLHEQ